MIFNNLLIEFDNILKQYNPVEYKKLLDPLSPNEVEIRLVQLGIEDIDFRSFYNWKNGERKDTFCEMMEYGGPLSLTTIKETISESYYPYNRSLIPFISEGEEMLLFNIQKGRNYGKIYLFSPPQLYIDFPISYYDSIFSMIKTTIIAYQKKIYKYDFIKNRFQCNYYELHEQIKKMNPNSVFWSDHDPLHPEEWYEI